MKAIYLNSFRIALPFAYLALFDGVVIPHQFGQGVQESSKSQYSYFVAFRHYFVGR